MVKGGEQNPARRLGRSRRVGVPPETNAFCPKVKKTKSSRKNCCCCGNPFFFGTNGTASNRGEGRGQHNVMETADFAGKPFPCPVCNMELRLKISRKQKPYCMCLECGIQIFFRGQAGIDRLHKMIRWEEAVVVEFSGPARAISLYNRLQHLKRQKKALQDKQGFIFWDKDRDRVIEALDAEMERVRTALKQAKKDPEERK